MPKCIISGCDQTAFYGQRFNQPLYCRAHVPTDAGSVKKKCAYGQCANAAIGKTEHCPRCEKVHASIAGYANSEFAKLDAAIAKEVNAITQTMQQQAANPTPAREPTGRQSKQQPVNTTSAATPAPAKTPKIVRTPDAVQKPESQGAGGSATPNVSVKKRTQTPGPVKTNTKSGEKTS